LRWFRVILKLLYELKCYILFVRKSARYAAVSTKVRIRNHNKLIMVLRCMFVICLQNIFIVMIKR